MHQGQQQGLFMCHLTPLVVKLDGISYKEQILDIVSYREEKVVQCQIKNHILT
jgi:hypothetical protein